MTKTKYNVMQFRSAVAMLVAVIMLLSVLPLSAFASDSSSSCALTSGCMLSDGHEGDCIVPDYAWYSSEATNYTIATAEELFAFAAIVNGTAESISADSFTAKTVSLANDIDLGSVAWAPIGISGSMFCGTFDGAGFKISGLNVDVSYNGAGLFGMVGGGTYIKNLIVYGSVKTSGKYAGGIVGNSSGSGTVTIENCGNYASVTTGGANAAGIIGCNDGSAAIFTIKNCYNVGNIIGNKESSAISGWVGNNAIVENCWNIGSVNGIASGNVFARYGSGVTFTNCYQFDELYKQEYTGITNLSYSGSKEDAVSSGQIASLLGDPWGQNLGEHNAPVIGGNAVYSGYTDSCKMIYSNSPEGLNSERPAHDDNYVNLQSQCGVCGEWHPESVMYKGLDLTEKTEDDSDIGWSWDADTKTLTLTDCTINSSAESVIKLPDGATIEFSGDNAIGASYSAPKVIHALGSLTIRGSEDSTLSAVSSGGYAVYCENAGNDVLLTIEDAILTTSGGEIKLPNTNKNSSVKIVNSTINTNEKRFEINNSAESTSASFVMVNSSYKGDKLFITDANGKQSTNKVTVTITDSTIDATQTNGSAIDSAFNISARDLDLDISNSYIRAWTKGWTGQNGNSYGMRLDAYGDADINISGSNFLTYGASTGFYIDVCGSISAESAIEDSTVISYAKNNPGDVHVWDNDSDNSGWANDDRRDIFKDSILLEYSYMSGQKHSNGGAVDPSGNATVVGSPELTRDFIIPENIGLEIKLASVTPTLTLDEGQSINVKDGVTFSIPTDMILDTADGVVLVTFDSGDSADCVAIAQNSTVAKPSDPADTDTRTFVGWYADEEGETEFDFTQIITEDTTVYAVWKRIDLTGTVQITGNMQVGSTLTATVSNTNNTGELKYQWYRRVENSIAIQGATESTYTLTSDDVYQNIYCEVSSTKQAGIVTGSTSGTVKPLTFADGVIKVDGYSGKYDANPHSITVTVPDGATIEYSTDDETYSETNPKYTNAGTYTVYYSVSKTGYKTVTGSAVVSIAKADQTSPAVEKTDETISKKADGTITGVTADMEYRKDGETTYTAVSGDKLEKLAAGKYYVRYKGDDNHNPSGDTEIIIKAGRKLKVVLPADQEGYTITATPMEYDYWDTVEVTLTVKDGYTVTDDFKVLYDDIDRRWSNEQRMDIVTFVADDLVITVEGIADNTVPNAEIAINENKWTSFWNDLTFGLFFNETQEVTIDATDIGSGVKSVEYYLAYGELELDEVRAITDWQGYNGAFKIDPNDCLVIYVKVTDNAGNTLFINSDGITLDNVAPTLEGIENGQTYYGDLIVIKSDEQFYNIKTVTLDGVPMAFAEGTYGLIPADNGEHTVVVEDHAGNKTTYIVIVYKNYTVTYKANGETVETVVVGHGNDVTAPAIPEKDGYTASWDNDGKAITADTVINAVYTIKEYTVTFMCENGVYKTLTVKHGETVTMPNPLEKDGYTASWDNDGKAITADTVINAVYTIKEYTVTFMCENGVYKTLTVKHGETITMPEPPAKDGYTVKWEKVISTVNGDVTVNAVYTEIPKPNPPSVGDNGNVLLWIVLAFVSGSLAFCTASYSKGKSK